MRANQLRQEFFTPETLAEICSRLVTHYFLLTPAELELWDTDPESFGKYLYTYIHIYIYIIVNIYIRVIEMVMVVACNRLGSRW